MSKYYLILGIVFLSLSACSAQEQAQVQTIIAPIAQTAQVEGQRFVRTQAAEIRTTGVAQAGTSVAAAVQDVATRLVEDSATQIATILTPSSPIIVATPAPRDTVAYRVVQGDTLTLIAVRFALSIEQLTDLNVDRYPSLLDQPDFVEVGWLLILVGELPKLPPSAVFLPGPVDNTPTCDVSDLDAAQGTWNCQPSRMTITTNVSFNVSCIVWDSNPLGYVVETTTYDGWVIALDGRVVFYSWYGDVHTRQIVIGPLIVREKFVSAECGVPGNP